jgi:hexosaminidase
LKCAQTIVWFESRTDIGTIPSFRSCDETPSVPVQDPWHILTAAFALDKIFKYLYLLLIMFLYGLALLIGQAVAVSAAQQPIWPLPQTLQYSGSSTNTLVVDQGFKFTTSGSYGSVMDNAISRYQTLIAAPAVSGLLKICNIVVSDTSVTQIIGADESYTLNVVEDGSCTISAQTVWGAMRGMESFTHFLLRNPEESNRVEVTLGNINVEDAPRFHHRGLMIDTARHYLSVSTIQKVIDTLPVSK